MSGPGTRRAVFLDRDGVLNRAVVKNGKPLPPATLEEFTLYPDVAEGVARLKAAGFLLVVATNQPDVGRGTQSRESVEAMHERLCGWLPLDRVEVCYEAGGQPDRRRKPEPGMLQDAAAALGIDLRASYMIGDRWRDIDCGRAAGCATIFIDRDYQEPLRQAPDVKVRTFAGAVEAILGPRPAIQENA